MSTTPRRHLTIPQGDTYRYLLTINGSDDLPIDLSGYTARCQFRATVASLTTLLDCSTSDYITLGGSAGTLLLSIPDTVTEAWTFTTAVYDIEIIDSAGKVKRVVQGTVTVDPEVTR